MEHGKLLKELGADLGLVSVGEEAVEGTTVEPLKVRGKEAAEIDLERNPRWASMYQAAKALKELVIDGMIQAAKAKDTARAAAELQKIVAQAAMLATDLRLVKLSKKLVDLMANNAMWEEREGEGADLDEAKAPMLHIADKGMAGTLCGISKEKAMKAKPPFPVVSQDDAGEIEPSERWCPKCLKAAKDQGIKVDVRESEEGSGPPFVGEAGEHEGEKMVFGQWRKVDDTPGAPAAAAAPAAHAAPAAAPEKPAKKAKRPTFDAAKEQILSHLATQGWKVQTGLKVPHATSPDGNTRYWFKAQAVHKTVLNDPKEEPQWRVSKHDLGAARSTWGKDIRDIDPADFTKHH